MGHVVGNAADRDAVMLVGPALESYFALANRYYDAYASYVSGRGGETARDGRTGSGVSRVADDISGILPPVWIGRGSGSDAVVPGPVQTIGDLLGVLPAARVSANGDVSAGGAGVGGEHAVVDKSADTAGADSGNERGQDVVEDGVGSVCFVGRHNARNRVKRANRNARRKQLLEVVESAKARQKVDSVVSEGSVHTVDTRTGVEIEAAQTLAARRVAENKMAEAKANVERKMAEHRLRALHDKDRTKAVERLAAARMEEKINKAKKNSEEAFKGCEASLKSLGSTGSAGEFALKQQIKDARETELLLKYTRAQADMYAIHASPEVLAKVAALPPPVFQDEFEVFGDCPDYYTEAERAQYYDDLNRRNAEKVDYADTGDAW